MLVEWAEGAPFDNNREVQITRYFGKSQDVFNHGKELKEGMIGVCEKAWLRYAEFEIQERDENGGMDR